MIVCSDSQSVDWCEAHGLTVVECYDGAPLDYDGTCSTIVIGRDLTENQFYYLKWQMLQRGIEILSPQHVENDDLNRFLAYAANQEKKRRRAAYGGRQPFGFVQKDGEVYEVPELMDVAREIIRLHDEGKSLRQIREIDEIRGSDGRRLSISTIATIVKKRERYERKEEK